MPVESIGSYRLVELLGSGAMGEVYKATDAKMFDRVVAVKLLSEKFARNENARSRFQNEIQYAAHLDHPNIIKIYDHGDIDGRPFFVMEFLDGIDLARFMKEETNRNVERSVEIARQLCEALDFAHRHNVVHRDVKPANVMIVRRGGSEQVKLLDFGIIHVESSKMTRDGTQPGTSAYSSPEQLRNDPVDHRSDLFSLGIVLYELFTNVYPFDAPSEALITHHILQREPETPRKRNPTIPAAIDVLVMKLLEKDPAQRPQTAGEVAEALRQQLRKLQSRWASTDPAEYENLDEITREAVDKLVAWARQKEADGLLQEAVDAYEKALKLAPESDRIQRRIPKLRHRIESDRLLREHLAKAGAALAEGRFPEARDHWKNAWILSPESEDVAALELRIQGAEQAAPDDREKKRFVDDLVALAEEALDAGRLDEARSEVVKILQRYPKDPLANFMLERILSILMAGVDYAAYRKSIREARDLVDEGRFADARARCVHAQGLWPGDEEAASVEREIDQRVEGEVAAIATRVEKALLRADDPDVEDKAALVLIGEVRADVAKARTLGSGAPWIRTSAEEADRVERSVHERIARAEAFRREQDEQRLKRLAMFLQRGRNQLAEAEVLAGRVTTEPGPAIEAYGLARESFERVLQDEATHAEALEARRRIEESLRDLAVRVDGARAQEREIGSALEAARAAVAEAEIAGGAHAKDLGAISALLHDAELALDRVFAIQAQHPDAVPLHARAAALRGDVLEEQERREAQAREAQKRAEDVERRKAEDERRKAEDERRKAEAELQRENEAREAEQRRHDAERRAAEDAETKRRDEEKRAADESARRQARDAKRAKEAEPVSESAPEPAAPSAADPRKLADFEKGLAKHRRLVEQGKKREAAEIQRILQTEAASDAQLEGIYRRSFPAVKPVGGRRGMVWGGVAAGVIVVALGIWAATWSTKPPAPQSVRVDATPKLTEVHPEPFAAEQKPLPPPPTPEEARVVPPPPQISTQPERVVAPKPKPGPEPPPKDPPRRETVVRPAPEPARAPKPEPETAPAAIPQGAARILACLINEAGAPVGEGYRVAFSMSGRPDAESSPTDAGGCAVMDVDVSGSVSFRPVSAKGPGSKALNVKSVPRTQLFEGDSKTIQVQIAP